VSLAIFIADKIASLQSRKKSNKTATDSELSTQASEWAALEQVGLLVAGGMLSVLLVFCRLLRSSTGKTQSSTGQTQAELADNCPSNTIDHTRQSTRTTDCPPLGHKRGHTARPINRLFLFPLFAPLLSSARTPSSLLVLRLLCAPLTQTDRQTDKRTGRRDRKWCALAARWPIVFK